MGLERSPNSQLGPYMLGERLGVGGMAEVYLAESVGPHGFAKRVALKRILPQLARDARFVAMFCDEAKICAMLEHPNIVKVIDFGEANGELFMAMEYVDGISVARLLRAVSARGERFPLGVVLFIAHEILCALSHAHSAVDERGRPLNIVHRDVSPGNVLIGRAGEVKLTDFGIVRSAFVDRRTYPGELKGKLGYMSPEQVMGDELDPRSDLFTTAIIIAELSLVRPLFPGQNELEILTRTHTADLEVLKRFGTHLPQSLVQALEKALSASASGRFQTAHEFQAAIRDVARREGLTLNAENFAQWMSGMGILRVQSGAQALLQQQVRPNESGAHPVTAGAPRPSASGTRQIASNEAASQPSTTPPPHATQDTLVDFEEEITQVGARFWMMDDTLDAAKPIELPSLLQRIVTGRTPLDMEVSRDGTHYAPLRIFKEFSRLTKHPAYSFVDGRLGQWGLRLARWELPSVLYYAAQQQLTGVMRFDVSGNARRLLLNGGRPRLITSQNPEELLGARLVAAGLLTRQQLSRLLVLACERSEALGRVCTSEGILTEEVLERQLHQQFEARLSALTSEQEALVSFVPGLQTGELGVSKPQPLLQWISKIVVTTFNAGEVLSYLEPCLGMRLSPGTASTAPSELGLSGPMRRAMLFACSGETLSGLVHSLRIERIAQERETLLAVFVGLSAGLLKCPGFVDPVADLRG